MKIIADTDGFQKWLADTHPDKNPAELFDGYKFSIVCCLNSFLEGVTGDELLGIENDFTLNRADAEMVPLHELKNTCEKTIFLKHLKRFIKPILQSKDYSDLKLNFQKFADIVSTKFETILNEHLDIPEDLSMSKDKAIELLLIDFAHTYLVQINNNGPTANSTHPLSPKWTKRERLEYYLGGYKYSIQYLWQQLLGVEEFNKTALNNLHLTDSWRSYKYIEREKSADEFDFLNDRFNLDEQTNLDSYFYVIQRDVTYPLTEKYGIEPYRINDYFKFSDTTYEKNKYFSELLDSRTLKNSIEKLSWEKQINELLYWYNFELVDARNSQMHYGIATFNTMLAGTIALHNKKQSPFSKVIVTKFTHPHKEDTIKNDYSYGILVDTKSVAGHYSSGWVIYQDACGDYSGFSGSEYRASEKLINKYLKAGKVELREMTIPLRDFAEFTAKSIGDPKQNSLEQNKLIPDIIQKARAHLLELFVYYLCERYYRSGHNSTKNYRIELNSGKKTDEGEKDVLIYNDDEVILVECKLNPQSYNMEEILKKLNNKIQKYKQKRKVGEFWFWNELSTENKSILEKLTSQDKYLAINTVIVSNPVGNPILKGVSLKELKHIMQDYTSDLNK